MLQIKPVRKCILEARTLLEIVALQTEIYTTYGPRYIKNYEPIF
ncbi:hypothetical protein X975_17407, partial [Stegodyphus mimosarum]